MTPAKRMWHLVYALGKERLFSTRMLIMLPILLLFIPGMAWGFADPNIQLPADQIPENATETMFLASIGIVFAGTMAAVLIAHDGISRDRTSGVLEIRLSQPMPRWRQGIVLVFGHWSSIALPVAMLLILSMFLIGYRSDMWIPLGDAVVYIIAAMLVLLWYTVFALLASSIAKEQGSAIAFSIGLWFLFTLLWVLFTTLLAALNGVAVGDTQDQGYLIFEGRLDLLSPNGVYHHLLETRLDGVERGVSAFGAYIAAVMWTIVPLYLFQRRLNSLVP
ncbi:MAG: ABC transporter permease subunit [Candidatus Poseidoniaceae archaeon]|nr:ABC transporter permease subunit [Candidatus Poseidoniaceae archaeon]